MSTRPKPLREPSDPAIDDLSGIRPSAPTIPLPPESGLIPKFKFNAVISDLIPDPSKAPARIIEVSTLENYDKKVELRNALGLYFFKPAYKTLKGRPEKPEDLTRDFQKTIVGFLQNLIDTRYFTRPEAIDDIGSINYTIFNSTLQTVIEMVKATDWTDPVAIMNSFNRISDYLIKK